jgi:Xaa-Pro aminopeptidase
MSSDDLGPRTSDLGPATSDDPEPRTSNLEPATSDDLGPRTSDLGPDTRLIIAASERDANLYYATRFSAPDPFVLLWHGAEKVVLASDLEVDRARAQAQVDEVRSFRDYEERAKQRGVARPTLVDAVLELLRERGVSAVTVPADFPLAHADALRAAGIAVRAKADPFIPERVAKSTEEVAAITAALRATESVLGEAIDVIRRARVRDGVLWRDGERLTSEGLKRFIAVRLLERELLAQHTIVACGEQGCEPHAEGSGPLHVDQPIIIDVFPRHAGSRYFADITRTVVKGRASEALRRMFGAVVASQERAMALIKDGAEGEPIHREVHQTMEQLGFTTGQVGGRLQGFFHGTGHGLGLEIHEPPRISTAPGRLERGHVVTVEPGLYYPGLGGVRIEDVVVVTESGCRNLTEFPKHLEV